MIPAYRRPDSLRRVVESIHAQTYPNVKVVVSVDGPGHPEVEAAANSFDEVTTIVQPERLGVPMHFAQLAETCDTDFMMYAADDDVFEPFYIERCMDMFNEDTAAVGMQAQYVVNGQPMPAFLEGVNRYDGPADILKHAYGNLFYSVFRTSALLHEGKSWYRHLQPAQQPDNELAYFVCVSGQGAWVVLPDVGWRKATAMGVYLQARWEQLGGAVAPQDTHDYHSRVYTDVYHALDLIDQWHLQALTGETLREHAAQLARGWK